MTRRIETRRRDSADPTLLLVTVTHPDLTQPIRLVRDGDDLVSEGLLYEHYPFEFVHEARGENATAGASLTIDNLSPDLIGLLRASLEPPHVTLVTVMASDPDEQEPVLEDMPVTPIAYDALTIQGDIPKPQLLQEGAPVQEFNPSNCPGLHV